MRHYVNFFICIDKLYLCHRINSRTEIYIKSPQKNALSFIDMSGSTYILIQGILYVEINHLSKTKPIQHYQILN